MKLLRQTPIWVIGHEDEGDGHRTNRGFIRVISSGEFIKNQCFLECSKWGDKANAMAMVEKTDLLVYRVDEYEDGVDRLFLKLTQEN